MSEPIYIEYSELQRGMLVAFNHPEREKRIVGACVETEPRVEGVWVLHGSEYIWLLPGSVVELISKGDSGDN